MFVHFRTYLAMQYWNLFCHLLSHHLPCLHLFQLMSNISPSVIPIKPREHTDSDSEISPVKKIQASHLTQNITCFMARLPSELPVLPSVRESVSLPPPWWKVMNNWCKMVYREKSLSYPLTLRSDCNWCFRLLILFFSNHPRCSCWKSLSMVWRCLCFDIYLWK